MARGTPARAPSQHAYKGTVGQTTAETIHVTSPRGDLIAATVHTTINAVTDPELVERLFAGSLNTLRVEGSPDVRVDVPVVYHDPAAEVLALVLAEAQRHCELNERIRLLERLRDDRASVPTYAKDFTVVFGAAGLRSYLEQRAHQLLSARESSKEIDRRRTELAAREAELQRTQQQLAQSQSELQQQRADLERSEAELERMRAEARARVIAAVQTTSEPTTIGQIPVAPPVVSATTAPATPPADRDEIQTVAHRRLEIESEAEPKANGVNGTNPFHNGVHTDSIPLHQDVTGAVELGAVEIDEEPTGNTPMPAGADPLTTETHDVTIEAGDRWIESAQKVTTSTFAAKDGSVRLALVAGDALARGLAGKLDVRVLLHRLSTYPVVVVLVGPPAAMRTPSPSQLAVVPLDIAAEADRAVLGALARKFEVTVDVVTHGKVTRRVRLVAPLAENVAYIVRAADDHLRGIAADGESEPSYAKARDVVLGAGYDLLGVEHAEATEFRDDKLAGIGSAQSLRRAIAIARRFARPSREDYLVCARGYPLNRWRELRRHVLERAVAWGIWMGPELAQVAVSEGLARSRRDLIMKLDTGFEALRATPEVYDLDSDAAEDNGKALAEEARALGVELRRAGNRPSNGAIKSEDGAVVSGSINPGTSANGAKARSVDELIALLDDKQHRVAAATELCDRGDGRAAAPVINAVKKMSRAEAVRILGKSVKFGAPAAPPLMEGLQSSKAFLRHGCALALALLRTDEGTHAVIEQLMNEPTEIWREIARAIGQIGPTALMPLASYVGRSGEGLTPALQERVAWAMAHVGVRGGKAALEQMGAGQSVMAPIARQAIGLHSNAARDEVRVRPGQPNRDVTVNRAFSRRFFEALEADRPADAQAALHDLEASGPAELLDESDVILDEDDEAELDESDLIQT